MEMATVTNPYALVIDDEQDIRDVARMTLEFNGWRVLTAADGRSALDIMRREKPALVLVDLMMPAMSGMELCNKMTGELAMADVPVLMISAASAKAHVVQDFLDLPLAHHDFLHKPFEADALIAAVKALVPADTAPAAATPRPATPPAPAPAMPLPTPPAGPAWRVLVVDDEPDILAIMRTALSMRYTVETASNGMAGLEAAETFAPDFIITDINMPHMNGLQMVQAIRRHPVLYAAPVFFMTGETDKDLPRQAYDVGGNLYLRKPVDAMQLLKYIEHFLKETGLEPGAYVGRIAPPKRRVSKPVPAKPGPLRVLVVDHEPEHIGMLRRIFSAGSTQKASVSGGPFEMLSTCDPEAALGNLTRWQPDLIIYNTRNPGLDGVAFGQMLAMHHGKGAWQVVLSGTQFFPVEVEYSKRNFGLNVVHLDGEPEAVAQRLAEPVLLARRQWKPKQIPMTQLRQEDAELQKALKMEDDRQALQREAFRARYQGIQQFIDNTF